MTVLRRSAALPALLLTLLLILLLAGCTPVISPAADGAAPPPPATTPTAAPAATAPAPEEATPAAAGAATATPAPEDELSGEMLVGDAPVDSVDVLILESFPVQVQVRVQGNLPDGCTELMEPEVVQDGQTFRVRLPTQRPADAMCTQALVPFDTTVPLPVEGLAAGDYTVEVNGVPGAFNLAVDNTQ